MRIGIYGGSFDPPHIGHRLLAVDACEALGLDRLFVVPAGIQPLKGEDSHKASAADRLAMATLAFAGDDRLTVDGGEAVRPGLSFTVDTIFGYRTRFPEAELFLLLGSDSYESFGAWKNPERIRALCTIALLERGNSGKPSPEGAVAVVARRIDISSSEIRQRRHGGRSIVGFVSTEVLMYMEAKNLYAPPGASRE